MDRSELRIFLASPSQDTAAARQLVANVVREVAVDPKYARVAAISLVRWDDPNRPVAVSATGSPQQDVHEQAGRPDECQLFIGLLRHTMGGTLPIDRYGLTKERAWHCVEWEIDQALAGSRRGQVLGVWVWRDVTPLSIDPTQGVATQRVQFDASIGVSEYLASYRATDGTIERGFNMFSDPDQFAMDLRFALRNWIDSVFAPDPRPTTTAAEQLTSSQLVLLNALVGTAPGGEIPPEVVRNVLHEPVSGLRGYLLRRHAQWATPAGGRLDRRFVGLTMMIDPELEPTFDVGRLDNGHYDDLAELLAEHPDVGAWTLLGEPGSGKSTLLQHYELMMARRALCVLGVQDAAKERPEICVWQRLSDYTDSSSPPAQWLEDRWAAQCPGMPRLAELARVVQLRFLLDGLNEIKAPSRVAQLAAADRWAEWAAECSGQMLAPIFSVRTLDQNTLTPPGLQIRQIALAPWTPERMRRYCATVLGADNALWPVISGDPEQLALCSLPFNLANQCELFRELERPADNRAEMLCGLFWLKLREELARQALACPGLVGPADRIALAGGRWKQTLLALPRDGCIVRWLDATAERMHREGHEVSLTERELLRRVHELHAAQVDGLKAPPAEWLHAVKSLGILGESGLDRYTGEASLRFTHQLWQEFFAARGLRELLSTTPDFWPDLRAPALPALDDALARLSRQEPLPGPDVSRWEEPVKMAAQLDPDPARWIRAAQQVNLPLAARSAASVAARLRANSVTSALVDELQSALLQRSRDPATDVRLRIEAADALGLLGDPRYEVRVGPERARYLVPAPAHWVPVAAGSRVIGGDSDGDPDELPPREMTLDAFEMAFAPVTNAEFACFVEAGGYADERWWDGTAGSTWRREGLRNDEEIARYNRIFDRLRTDPEAAVAEFPLLTEAGKEQFREYGTWPEERRQEELEQWFGARKCVEPQEWRNPLFNGALQPVVGISLYEARAYANWLAFQTGWSLALPTEVQWEVSARGTVRHKWPWGDNAPSRTQINNDTAHLRRTSPVGAFPEGDGDGGLIDLAGNILEWTTSAYTDRCLEEDAVYAAPVDSPARRTLRGGSWDSIARGCRSGCRDGGAPGIRTTSLGMRLARRPAAC